jgi:uncharacterized protein
VSHLNSYNIPIKGLALGEHEVDYDVNNKFFSCFEESEIKNGNVTVLVHAKRSSSFIELDFKIEGDVIVTCDRCLDEFSQKISYEGSLFIKFSSLIKDDEGDIIYVDPNEGELNLASYIYESICLSLPYQRIHPLDDNGKSTCNPEMLERLEAIETNFDEHLVDVEVDDEEEEDEISWDEIKKLLDNK